MQIPNLRSATVVAALLLAAAPGSGCGSGTEERIDLLPATTDALVCEGDGDCAVPTPYCDGGHHQCVECLTNTNCGNKVCDPASHTCQGCQSSGDCSGGKPYCLDGECVECLAPGNCAEADQTCDPAEHKCVPICAADGDCTDSKRPLCWLAQEVCVECLSEDDCATSKPRCVNTRCRECASDSDCADAEPYCVADKLECKACLEDSDCDAGLRCDKNECKE